MITGPKWCGKTTTAEQFCKSSIYLQDPDHSEQYHEIALNRISALLEGENPRLIDEWQMEENLWNAVRFSVDHTPAKGLYILTESTIYRPSESRHSGAGRIAKIVMRTLSLYESGDSTGEVSLAELFEGKESKGTSKHSVHDVAKLIVRGGWPDQVFLGTDESIIGDYCEAILDSKIDLDGIKRDRYKMKAILVSLSKNVATASSTSVIRDDVMERFENIGKGGFSDKTLYSYIEALKDICMIEDMPAWNPKLRSKARIRQKEVRYLSDPAIAAYFLGAGPKDLEFDPETFGLLFECLVVRDLRVYAQTIDGKVYSYRDNTGLEVDCIIHLRNGKWRP